MAYTTIDKPTDYFNTLLYTSNNTDNTSITGVGFQPDFIWFKNRSSAYDHRACDSVRGANKLLGINITNAEATTTASVTSIDSDGYTLGADNDGYGVNYPNSNNIVAWNWLAGGTAPAITYSVKVVSDSGNKYRFDDFGTSAVTLDLQEGGTYTFDQSDSSNSGHPLRFSTTSDGTHGGGSEYTTNVTTTGTPGSAGAKTVITVASGTATLYYYCSSHSGMGGQANTNSTFGSSNFGGSIQSNVSANTTAGFSIVSYTGSGATSTIGHGLGSAPKWVIVKQRDNTRNWVAMHEGIGFTKYLYLDSNQASNTGNFFNNTDPSSTVFNVVNDSGVNGSGGSYIAYCFAPKKSYSKFGSYTGNGSTDGTFVYLGFRPAWVMIKRTDGTNSWVIYDNKREGYNVDNDALQANGSNTEGTSDDIDLLSNGFKMRTSGVGENGSGNSYIYMAFAENPFVTSTGIPTTAR